jgi:hypothetical protein
MAATAGRRTVMEIATTSGELDLRCQILFFLSHASLFLIMFFL